MCILRHILQLHPGVYTVRSFGGDKKRSPSRKLKLLLALILTAKLYFRQKLKFYRRKQTKYRAFTKMEFLQQIVLRLTIIHSVIISEPYCSLIELVLLASDRQD